MAEFHRTAWIWWRLAGLAITGGLFLASLISFIVNFDHIEHWTQFFAVATIVSAVVFSALGRLAQGARDRR